MGSAAAPSPASIKTIVTHEDRARLKHLAVDKGQSLQTLGLRAWSLLLAENGLPAMAPITANVPTGRRRPAAGKEP